MMLRWIAADARKEQARMESAYEEIREQLRSAMMRTAEMELQQAPVSTELQIQVEELTQRLKTSPSKLLVYLILF